LGIEGGFEESMKKVLVILPNAFELLEGAAFIDILGWANNCGNKKIVVVTAGVSSPLSCTFGGLRILPDVLLSDISSSEFDAVAIPGGFESEGFFDEAYSELILQILRDFNSEKKPIASICVGALPIAKSGILNGRRATTYHLSGGKRRKQLGEMGAIVEDSPIVVDGNVITSTSPATAIEVALKLVEVLTSKENADHVKVQLGVE